MIKLYILHGWAYDTHKWQLFLDLLSKNFQVILLKIPGLTAPLNQPWSLSDYTSWLASTLPPEPVILLGHSFGGRIALKYVATFPNSVSHLILIDSAGIKDMSIIIRLKRFFFQSLAKFGKLFFLHKLAFILHRLAGEHDYLQANPVMKATMAQVITQDLRVILSKIYTPTLIIWGKQDKVTPLWMGKYLSNHLPNSQLNVLPAARHSPHFTHPTEVSNIIAKYLRHPTRI